MAQVILFKTDNTGCGYYRCDLPAKILRESGISTEVRFFSPSFRSHLETKIVFFQRFYPFLEVEFLLKKFNGVTKIIYDLDDDFFHLTPDSTLFRIKEHLSNQIRLISSYTDVITVSTNYLKTLVQQFLQKDAVVIPNMLDLSLWEKNQVREDGRIRIGWAGSSCHHNDLVQISSVLKTLLLKYSFVDLHFFGYCPEEFVQEFKDRLIFSKSVSYLEYVKTLPKLGLDIGLIPIVENEFNKSKSAIKLLEYSAIGLPCVATNSKIYSEHIRDGENGFLASNPEEWLQKIEILITNKEKRLSISRESLKIAQKFDLNKKRDLWLSVFHNLLI